MKNRENRLNLRKMREIRDVLTDNSFALICHWSHLRKNQQDHPTQLIPHSIYRYLGQVKKIDSAEYSYSMLVKIFRDEMLWSQYLKELDSTFYSLNSHILLCQKVFFWNVLSLSLTIYHEHYIYFNFKNRNK